MNTDWIKYLISFGWADKAAHPDDYKAALDLFKLVFGIHDDTQLQRVLDCPRCGCDDAQFRNRGNGGNQQRPKWNKNNLVVFIRNRPQYLNMNDHDACIIDSFRDWSNYCNISFDLTNDESKADITLFYDRIDGPSNTLGYSGHYSVVLSCEA